MAETTYYPGQLIEIVGNVTGHGIPKGEQLKIGDVKKLSTGKTIILVDFNSSAYILDEADFKVVQVEAPVEPEINPLDTEK